MTYRNQNLHPMIRHMQNWEAYNIEVRRSAHVRLFSSALGIISFTVIIGLLMT